ncbi:BMP family ABC transporter substrate-binding protein [Clostridium botulinum]|nr:BMP family ABC transporter substrate-binding protein [Clostridium botulinum]NFI19012.1 BMP family ABC transporter substrate-binding protein [Clostridium botulinum]NFL94557.1 BMP family ABC transporter substrate-binding protein [Clostridium botulinum]NFN52428.1 BMP family ABC transporter substrate-binding protein [Clostridium botulinum]NFO26758.1 BMP family ABC transporter substrate-binding protein [Clostridium botulinum]
MKKKLLSLLAISAITVSMFAGCGGSSTGTSDSKGGEQIKVGMVTDSGTIDDKSFNQGTWEGIQKAEKDLGIAQPKYLKPNGETEADYMKEIGNLYDAGFRLIATPGFKFETAIFKSQEKYKDAKFVLIDGTPNSGGKDSEYKVDENSVSILFAEHQAGFLAGVATSVELKEGDLGFIGGMEIPAVQKFNWGFQQGVAYANEKLGTKMSLKADNILYQGTFNDTAAGQQLAAQMYDRGVKAIFCAAGGVGNGVITEAKTRIGSGSQVWVVGVDRDQFDDGVYADGKSVILTSAVKKVEAASFDMVKAVKEGTFPGGQTLTFDVTKDAVGIPAKNPNLSEATMKTVAEVNEKVKDGTITVAGEQGNLVK